MSAETSPHAVTFEMDDLDLAVDVAQRLFYPSVQLRPTEPRSAFSATLTAGRMGTISAGLLRYGCDIAGTIDGLDAYQIAVPLQGPFDLSAGRPWVTATPDSGAVIGPIGTSSFLARGTEQVCILKLERRPLETELARMLGRDVAGPVDFQPLFDLRTGRGAEWANLAQFVVSALRTPDGMSWNPLLGAHMASTLMSGLLLTTEHQYRELLDTRGKATTPATIKRAVDLIEERAHEPLTLPFIASSIGASARTLHRGFVEHLGTTPHKYLARVRLERAHRDLTAGSPATTSVTEVAARWGYSNTGRFAASYRAKYGATPFQTLRTY